MNLLHISDMHFGCRHWQGNNDKLLEKLNAYPADIVLNTGDNTTDSLKTEFIAAGQFLKSLDCDHVISIVGNHDKRNMQAQDFFREYIDDLDVIHPQDPNRCTKNKIYLDQFTTGIKENLTDINFIKKVVIDDESLLIVCLDTCEIYQDNGFIDQEILNSVSHEIEQQSYDKIILLNHHSILETDSDPLYNSGRIIEFIRKHKIKDVFCGHTHKLELIQANDLYYKHSFTQYKNGSLSSINSPNDSNMFLFYEDFGTADMKIHIIRIFDDGSDLRFEEEILTNLNS